jgi:hypothetical protein
MCSEAFLIERAFRLGQQHRLLQTLGDTQEVLPQHSINMMNECNGMLKT